MGLPDALCSGWLSAAVGVHEGQQADLRRVGESIHRKTMKQIEQLLVDAEKEMFSHLTPEQRERAEEITSGTAAFVEPTRHQSMYTRYKHQIDQGIDPFAQKAAIRAAPPSEDHK